MTTTVRAARERDTAQRRWARAGYAAFVLGLLQALLSAYWAVGGPVGLDQVGGKIAELARERSPGVIAGMWLVVLAKVIGAVLGLAVVRRWGRRVPRRLLLTACWGATTVLVGYGGLTVAGELLSWAGVIHPAAPIVWEPFMWHMLVWDPAFLVWGLFLGAATWRSPVLYPPRARRGAARPV
jgi:hypothetical protein